jgi:hypothetical protein
MAPTAYPKRDLPLRYGGRAFAISHPGRGDPHDAGGAVVLGRVRAERAGQRNGALEGDIVHGITQPAGDPTQHGSFTLWARNDADARGWTARRRAKSQRPV